VSISKKSDLVFLKNAYVRISTWSKRHGFDSKTYSTRGKIIVGDNPRLAPKKIQIDLLFASNSGRNDQINIVLHPFSSIQIEFRDYLADKNHIWSGVYTYWTKNLQVDLDKIEVSLEKALKEWKQKENCKKEQIIVY
jgi:hypothetical protein